MAARYQKGGTEVWEICSPGEKFRMSFIPELGGLGISLRLMTDTDDRELLWLHPDFWEMPEDQRYGGFPFLFPICGRQEKDGCEGKYNWNGQSFELPIHGFAPRIPWEVIHFDNQILVMQLTDSPETINAYPFSFHVELTYQLQDDEMICRQKYTNRGNTALPYIAGFHPYFRVPSNLTTRQKCSVDFSAEKRCLYNSGLTAVVGTDKPLTFPASITNPALNESLHRVNGPYNGSRMTLPDGLQIELEAYSDEITDMFPYTQLFTQNQYDFFCIEPWMGTPNGLNTEGGYRLLAPNDTEKAVFRIRICNS